LQEGKFMLQEGKFMLQEGKFMLQEGKFMLQEAESLLGFFSQPGHKILLNYIVDSVLLYQFS
jgi:hypothetical protein